MVTYTKDTHGKNALDCKDRTAKAGQPEWDSIIKTGHSRHGIRDRKDRKNGQNMTASQDRGKES
jgi:hypothetical protein